MTGRSRKPPTAEQLQKLTAQQTKMVDAAQRLVNSPAVKAASRLMENAETLRIQAELDRHREFIRSAQGPYEELRRAGVFDAFSAYGNQLHSFQAAMDSFNDRYVLPDLSAAGTLIEEFERSSAAEALARYALKGDELRRATEAMNTAWLDPQAHLSSITGIAEIHGIGKLLENGSSFDQSVCVALRHDLGDWRDSITWPEPVLTDPDRRSEFYRKLGFDASLTNFPGPAFHESTENAGLLREPPPVVAAYSEPVPPAGDPETEEAFTWSNQAHDWLQRLESHIREFIDNHMTEAFGDEWPKHQLPNGIYDQWVAKREAAIRAGRQPRSLIAYADFTDYEKVICKRDNWRTVFCRFYGRPENVRESFQRLHPIRLDTMHARPIIQDDQLLLYVEVRRLIQPTIIT